MLRATITTAIIAIAFTSSAHAGGEGFSARAGRYLDQRTQPLRAKLATLKTYLKTDAKLFHIDHIRSPRIGQTPADPRTAIRMILSMTAQKVDLGPAGSLHRAAASRTLAKGYRDLLEQVAWGAGALSGTVYFARSQSTFNRNDSIIPHMLKDRMAPVKAVLAGKIDSQTQLSADLLRALKTDARVAKTLRKVEGKLAEAKALVDAIEGNAPSVDTAIQELMAQ